MSKIAQCPECGAEVAFTQPGSILSVCGFCHSVVARRDVDVESLGKIGLIADVPSVLQRHLRGRAFGGFIVAGRLQLDHGAGTWNEWYLGLDDGRWLWLAETQGRYYLTAATALAGGDIPGFEGAHPGHTVRLPLPPMPTSAELRLTEAADAGGTLLLRVSEVHTATIVAAEGELPFAVRPGRPVRYLDLSGARGTFGTLDYGPPDAGPDDLSAFLGREVELQELGLELSSVGPAPAGPRVKAARMECPQCHGALELRAPDAALRVVCPYCQTLSEVGDGKLAPLKTLKKHDPPIPLGKRGSLRGTPYQIIGYNQRRIVKTGFVFDEYVMAAGEGGKLGFHYLLEAGGHYTLVRPAHLGDIKGKGPTRYYEGELYTLCERCTTEVSHLAGEFPWAVELGERVRVEDYARPGWLLSLETSLGERQELNVSLGEYLEPAEVHSAFGPPAVSRSYIAPHQPNPHAAAYARQKPVFWRSFLALLGIMVLALFLSNHRRDRHQLALSTVAGAEPGAEQLFLSEPFELGRKGLLSGRAAVEVGLRAEVDNSWLGTDLVLINDDSGESHTLSLELGYYHGVADGESWSEGTKRATALLPAVPAGRYILRVEPSWPVLRPCETTSDCAGGSYFSNGWSCVERRCQRTCGSDYGLGGGGSCPTGYRCDSTKNQCVLPALDYTLTLDYGKTRLSYGWLALLLLSAVPLFTLYRRNRFEQRRREDQDPIEP